MLKDRLKTARKSAKMTQKEVATALGVTESTYCGYETGKRQPDAVKIGQIANILGVTGDYLLETDAHEVDGVKKRPTLVSEDGFDELDIQLMDKIKTLSPERKQALLDLLFAKD